MKTKMGDLEEGGGGKKFWSSTYLYTEVILSNTKDLELICIEQ